MPWKDMPPDWLAALLDALHHSEFWAGVKTFLAAMVAAGVGVMAKIADEVKNGDRRKFFSAQLWLDLPAWCMVALITVGASAYYDLSGPISGAIGAFLGYAGPRAVDAWLAHKLRK